MFLAYICLKFTYKVIGVPYLFVFVQWDNLNMDSWQWLVETGIQLFSPHQAFFYIMILAQQLATFYSKAKMKRHQKPHLLNIGCQMLISGSNDSCNHLLRLNHSSCPRPLNFEKPKRDSHVIRVSCFWPTIVTFLES